jgi:hypothetical protein
MFSSENDTLSTWNLVHAVEASSPGRLLREKEPTSEILEIDGEWE